jgi:hypothetical protein
MPSNYDTYPLAFDFVEGFAPRWENSVEVGNSSLWGSLDISSYIYTVYGASVGLQEDAGWQIGATDDLQFEYTKDYGQIEIGNVISTGVYELESEEATLSFSMYEWKPDALAMAFNATMSQVTATDALIQFGGGCDLSAVPIIVRGTNISCNATAISNLTDGVDYAVLTLYDCYQAEGFTLPFQASEDNPIDLSIVAKPVLSLTAGERIGNLYLATD